MHQSMIRILRRIFGFYVHAHFHVALAAVALYALYAHWYEREINKDYTLFLFFSTLFYYTLLRLMHLKSLRPCVARWYDEYGRWMIFLIFVSGGFSLAFFFRLPVNIRTKWMVTALLALFYQWDDKSVKSFSLRNLGKLKIAVISFVWSGVTFWAPLSAELDTFAALAGWIHAFLFVLLWTIPFDIRDLHLDDGSLKTLPMIFKEKTFYFILGLVTVYEVYTFYIIQFYSNRAGILFMIAGLMFLAAGYLARHRRENYYFSAFWVEGIPIWLWIVYTIWMN